MLSWQHSFYDLKPSKQRSTTWFSVCDQSSSVGLCMQEYISLCPVVRNYDTLVKHRHVSQADIVELCFQDSMKVVAVQC